MVAQIFQKVASVL